MFELRIEIEFGVRSVNRNKLLKVKGTQLSLPLGRHTEAKEIQLIITLRLRNIKFQVTM